MVIRGAAKSGQAFSVRQDQWHTPLTASFKIRAPSIWRINIDLPIRYAPGLQICLRPGAIATPDRAKKCWCATRIHFFRLRQPVLHTLCQLGLILQHRRGQLCRWGICELQCRGRFAVGGRLIRIGDPPVGTDHLVERLCGRGRRDDNKETCERFYFHCQ